MEKQWESSISDEIKVSVIIPIYNNDKYIEACVQSALHQTVKNIEVILVDDGSTDQAPLLCDKFAEDDTRVKVIHKVNEGVSVARNVGMSIACGEWIMFMDSDDSMKEQTIERLLCGEDSITDIIACCCDVFVDGKFVVDNFFAEDRAFSNFEEKKDLYLQLMDLTYKQPGASYTAIGVPWGKLYRRRFLQENDLQFDSKLKRLQDNIFNMYAFHCARRIVYVNEPLYNYRYEHIQFLYQRNPDRVLDSFPLFMAERHKCIIITGISEDADIQQFAVRERLVYLVRTLNFGVFNPENKITFRKKRYLANNICNMDCFQELFINANGKSFSSPVEKITFCVLKNRQFTLFYFMLVIKRVYDRHASGR